MHAFRACVHKLFSPNFCPLPLPPSRLDFYPLPCLNPQRNCISSWDSLCVWPIALLLGIKHANCLSKLNRVFGLLDKLAGWVCNMRELGQNVGFSFLFYLDCLLASCRNWPPVICQCNWECTLLWPILVLVLASATLPSNQLCLLCVLGD